MRASIFAHGNKWAAQQNTDLHELSGFTRIIRIKVLGKKEERECVLKLEKLCENNAIDEKNKLETVILVYLDKIPAKNERG